MFQLRDSSTPKGIATFTRNRRFALITFAFVLSLGSVAISKSPAIRERLGISSAPKPAIIRQTPPKGAANMKIDLLRTFGRLSASRQPLSLASPFAPTVSATKSDSLFTDVDGDLQADPGDTLKYTVNISASGQDATGVTFTDTVDPNTAFVPGSLRATPLALDDTYAATGNIRISVAAPGVLGNDFAGVPAATITAPPTTSANGGDVTLNADGSFTYNPPAGFEGVDSFNYTLTNSAGSNSATVTITVSGMIWFIDNNAPACTTLAAGCGRLTNPFSSLAAFAALNNGSGNNPAANDNIFIYESASDYAGPVTLLNGQRFIGQDATASLSAITGITPPSGSDPLPTTNSANGTIVNITTGNAITVASGNMLTGFTGGNSTTDISGTGFGALTISDVTLNGTGQALNLTTGALTATFGSISSTNSATTGISLTGVAGSLNSPTTTITNATGVAISVGTSTAVLNFGNTTSTLSGGAGVSLLTNTGNITFGNLNISPDASQEGLVATDNSGTITSSSGAISTAGATAVDITRASGTTPLVISLTSVSANGGTNGIVLTNTNGSFTVTGDAGSTNNSSGGTIQSLTNFGINLNNTQNISLDQMNLQSITKSGINGTQVTNFSFTNGTINNAGTASFDSSIAFNGSGTGTGNNIAGTLTITGNTLTNAFFSGVDVQADNGTVSNANVSNNTITNTTQGQGINFSGRNTAATAFNLQNATINQNNISGIGGTGIQALCTSSTAAGPGASCGTPGDATKLISITNNSVSLQTTAAQAITISTTGTNSASRAKGNFLVQCNGRNTGGCTAPTAAAIGSSAIGTVMLVGNNGFADMTAVLNNNAIVATHTANLGGGNGIGGGNGAAGAGNLWTPQLTLTVTNNSISGTDGNGILLVGRGTSGFANMKITDNNVATPVNAGGAARQAIRVDAGNAASADDGVCVTIANNTSPGGSNGASGIGIRKQGNTQTINDFGITGLSPSPTTAANAAAFVATQNPAGNGCDGISGNNYQSCGSAPAMMSGPGDAQAMRMQDNSDSETSGSAPSGLAETVDVLRTTHGEGPSESSVHKLTQGELMALMPAAIERWKETGISMADLSRLQAVTFAVANLPEGQLASATSTNVEIDETAAGYGWYSDVSPMEDSEFEVPVPGKEFQTTEFSPSFGHMDLLTVVMRELGNVYLKGKKLTKQLKPLMEGTLSPGVRRLPDSRIIQLTDSKGRVSGKVQSNGATSVGSRTSKASVSSRKNAVATSPAALKNAGLNPIAKAASRKNSRIMHHAAMRTMTPSMLADVMLSIGTLPAGESVTITFNVTVDDPFTGASPQVSNQGTVSGSNFADVLTDDPDVGGTDDPTVTPIDLPQVSVAVAPASVLEDGATNLVYTFTRTGSTANAMTVNFSVGGTASFTQPDYTQTGAATFTASSGTVVIPGGSSTATVTIDPSADSTVEPDETVDLTVTSGTGYTVGSPSAASGTITNDDADVSVTVSPGSVSEDGATNLVYTFTRAGATANPLTVNFSVGGTANFGASPNDYTETGATTFSSSSGSVTFGPGSSTATVTVDPEADTTVEGDETVILSLTSGAGYNVGSPSSATGTITNDDADVSVAVAPASVTEDGATNLVYTFTRSGFTAGALTVNFSVGGTATFGVSPDDYTQTGATTFTTTSGSVTFAPGNSTATVTVNPEADTTAEADETVIISLTAGASYNVVNPSSATGTILNDDTLVSVAVSPSSTTEGGANMVYTFTRTGPTTSSLTVNFSVGGSASFPADYSQSGAATFTPPTATVNFGAGSSTATVTVTPLSDCDVEGSETVVFTVQPGTGYGVGSPSSATGTIANTPDSTPPTITLIPNVNITLWPPNHQYDTVAVTDFVASASDNCDPTVNLSSVYIQKITSDEVENGNGDGNTLNDIVIAAGCKTAQLRSERDGSADGRVYTITFKVKDSTGNFTTATAQVTVRKNPNTPAVDSGTHYTVNSVCP
jgi:hypothetical protein